VLSQTYKNLLAAVKGKRTADEPQFKADFDDRLLSTFDETKAERLFHLRKEPYCPEADALCSEDALGTNKDNHNLNEQDMEFGKKVFAKDLNWWVK
jgi:hypothetical protein